ncbi:hypothetical protein BGW39_002113 [Mortierella sp. 14UC]|nr:hypothetical protein BGW39_002113 [Mortierella sp. 14UC]
MQDTSQITLPPPPPPQLIPDTVRLIAAHLSKRDLARCSRVSHAWRDVWADSLWSHFSAWTHRTTLALSLDSLVRVGPHIRKLDLRCLGKLDDDSSNRIHGDILRTCLNVRHLEIAGYALWDQAFYSWLSTGRGIEGTEEKGINSNKAKMSRLFRNAPPLALFSNNLATLQFVGRDYTCEMMMHWIGLAARTDSRLQNLEKVAMAADGTHVNYRTKGYPLRLSYLFLFLRSVARLKSLTLYDCDIVDDIPDAVIDAVFPPSPKEYIKQAAAAEPKSASSSSPRLYSLETLSIQEFDSPSALAKLLRRLPTLSSFYLGYLDGRDYLAALRLFYCGHDLQLIVNRRVASDIKEDAWVEFFGDDGYNQSSLKSPLLLPGHSNVDERTTITTSASIRPWCGLSMNFKGSHVHGFTNKIAKLIVQSPIMSDQLTGLDINAASNLSFVGAKAILYNCPNLRSLSLKQVIILGDIFEDPAPWACRSTLSSLVLSKLVMGDSLTDGQEYGAAARHHIRQLPQLKYLDLQGEWVLSDMVIDHSLDMGRGERLYTGAGKQDAMVWPKMYYFSLSSPKRYITLPEFKLLLSMFPFDTFVELWAWVQTEAETWIMENRRDMVYILHAGDYYD